MISIITPSLGDIEKLRALCLSLQAQKDASFELIICTTGVDTDIKKHLPQLPSEIRQFDSPENCISHARNLGLKNARGDMVLFLDDDCHLPHEAYLRDLHQAHVKNRELCGGGFYLNYPRGMDFTSRFYNFFCNLWLHAHLSSGNSAQLLLGGCAFYSRKILSDNDLHFSALYKKAGEEYAFNHSIATLGHRLELQKQWSVYHNPDCNFGSLVRRAWVQGRSLEERSSIPTYLSLPFIQFLAAKPLQTFLFLPLLAIYLGVSRFAYWTRERHP